MPGGGSRRGERRGGRKRGTPNKTTRLARDAIETAAAGLGGAERLAEWAKEKPENETAFWTRVYPRLLPVQVHAGGPDGEPLAPGRVAIWLPDNGRDAKERLAHLIAGETAAGAADNGSGDEAAPVLGTKTGE
jgi:hypothetical protein